MTIFADATSNAVQAAALGFGIGALIVIVLIGFVLGLMGLSGVAKARGD